MKNIKCYSMIPLLLLGWMLQAQEIRPVAKQEVLQQVLENNQRLKISEQEFLQARAQYRQTNAIFLPNISVSHTGTTTTNPLMAFGSKLNQEIISQSDFNPQSLNDPERTDNFATKVEVKQPLINLDGVFQRKAANAKMEASELQTERAKDHMKLEVEKAYMQLQLAYKAVDVLEEGLKAAQANKKMADDRFDQGYLQKSDVLAVQVRLSEIENRLRSAKNNLQNASDYLAFLMNESQDVTYKPSDSLQIEGLQSVEKGSLSEERSDIQAMQLAANAREEMYKASKMEFLPKLNAFGSYELYDNKAFQGDAQGYLAGIQLSWDIFQGSKRFGKAQQTKAEYQQAKLEYEQYVAQSNMELNKAQRDLRDAESRLETGKLSMEQAKESLRIRTNRYDEGLERTSDLLSSEALYLQKELEYYQTIYEYNYAQAYLEFLTKA